MKKTFYYTDELNDDFAKTNIKRKPLPKNHKYFRKNPLWHFCAFVLYRLIATPIGALFNFFAYNMNVVGRRKLKKYRKDGYFLYGNHTLIPGDAFTPTMVSFPKKSHIVVNPDATSLPVIGKIVEMVGGVPLPDDLKNMREFCKAIDEYAERGKVVVIYPEAHIWPYYTKIRPFKSTAFKYAAKNSKPTFCFTAVFTKTKILKRLKTTVYVDGPFLPDETLPLRENQEKLRDEVYAAMKKRSEGSTYEKYTYIKKEPSEENGEPS